MKRETFIDGNKTILHTDFYLYLLQTEEENRKHKKVIDKVIEEMAIIIRDCEESDDEDNLGPSLNDLNYILDILKEVE